jgi:hypothetical protein
VQRYALLNPHATFAYSNGEPVEYPARDDAWGKWTPKAPTSPHWYTPTQFQALLSAFLHADRQTGAGARLISTVLAEFEGFSGSAARREVLKPLGLTRATLEALVIEGAVSLSLAEELLTAMQARARPVVPRRLGVLGEAHLREALTAWYDVDPETLVYRVQKGTTGQEPDAPEPDELGQPEKEQDAPRQQLPYILEVACAQKADPEAGRGLLCGFNFTPALDVPFRELAWICGNADVNEEDPIALVVHVTCPRLDATDRGKTAVALPDEVTAAMRTLVAKVAEPWTKLKAKVRREGKQRALQAERERRTARPMTVKDAAWQVMEQAYLKASSQGTLVANARQVMYAARPEIIRLTGKAQPWKHSSYFTQHLLPDFMEAHPELTAHWDVVFDARGHFREPHTGYEFGLGTVEVRAYMQLWTRRLAPRVDTITLPHTITTWGPAFRYQYALFVEKEGFDALLEQARLQDRYDVSLMSTKGMTVTSARRLIEALSRAGVTILVVHDFDKPGLEILHKFTANTRRYRYTSTPTVIDLGLRLEEAQAMGLESEPVPYETQIDPKVHLRECGATEEECAFLVTERKRDIRNGKWHVSWVGQRIELNAMTSQQFLDWLEAKLQAAGVAKVVPDDDALAVACRHLQRVAMLEQALEAARAQPVADTPLPADLAAQIRGRITGTAAAWDDALWTIVQAQGATGREADEAEEAEPEASP